MKTTVIITALDEPYVNKTIDGIIESDNGSLKEIIVIDDVSKEPISHPEAKVIRNEEQKGLVWGRNHGAELADSEIIISIDPHCKITSKKRWLSTISKRLSEDYNCVAIPRTYCLEPISWEEMKKTPGFKTKWDWKLDFNAGNVIKYVVRHNHKGKPLEDLKKARWYLQRLIDNIESKKTIIVNIERTR